MSLFSLKDFDNTKWYILEKLCQLIAGIYIVPKVFNSLGAYNFGELEISKSIVGALAPIFFLGLSVICIRELVFKPKLKYFIIGTSLALRLVSFFILFLFILVYSFLTSSNSIILIVLLLTLSYLFKISDVFEYYFIAIKNYKLVFICKITTLIIILFIQYYGVINNYNVYFFTGVLFFECVFQSIMYYVMISKSKEFSLNKLKASFKLAKQLLKSSFPLLISNFIVVFYITIDNFFINYYLGNAANGVFAVVDYLVIFITWNLGAAFIYGLYPALAECYLNDRLLYYKRFRFITKYVIIFGIIIGMFYALYGDRIISTYYNNSFRDAKLPLKIFAWSPLFIFLGMLFEKHLVNQDKLERNVYRFILGCFVNIILCYMLIPKFRLVGAAIAVLFSHFITNVVFILCYKSYRKNIIQLFGYA